MLTHLAIIPDGNRRWAKKLGKVPWYGHEMGIPRFRNTIDWCSELGIKELTFYTLSIQNFQRDKTELEFLFIYIRKEIEHWLAADVAEKKGVRFTLVGKPEMLPKDLHKTIKELEEKTKNNKAIKVNLAIGYGGKEEIIHAVNSALKKKQKITEETIEENLWLNSNPDLIIRTSGEYRTSNFLMWQSAYSEWFFSEKYWPDFDKEELIKAIKDYESRDRRHGK